MEINYYDELSSINNYLKDNYALSPDSVMQNVTITSCYYARLIEIANQVRGLRDEALNIFISKADASLKQEAYKDLRKSYTADYDSVLDYLDGLIKACQMRFEGSRSQLAYLKNEREQAKYADNLQV